MVTLFSFQYSVDKDAEHTDEDEATFVKTRMDTSQPLTGNA